MKKIKITTRKKDILNRLCSEDDYITIGKIAEDIGVSSRTILRELEEIGELLRVNGLQLDTKTGVGIRLTSTLEEKEKLLSIIESEGTERVFTPNERHTIIAGELLQNNEPIKLYSLTRILKVSEGTISNDLDKLEEWLNAFNLNLVRKPGLGVYIDGREKHKRRAIVNLIYENVEEKQLLNLVQEKITKSPETAGGIEIKTRNRLLNLIDKESIRRLEELIYKAEEEMGYKLADSAYVGLIVHLALAIKRIKNNEKIMIDQGFLKELRNSTEFEIAKALANNISNHFNIEILEDEVGYITMHLMGSKNRGNVLREEGKEIGNFELVKLVREIIKTAEAEAGTFIGNNQRLFMGLINHLEPAIKRLKLGMDIRNPLLEEIKLQYPQLLEITTKSVKGLEEYLGLRLPESEIAYIAMHLGAVIEKKEFIPQRRYRIAVACPSGIGTSRLLATRIEKEYDTIQIVDVISTIHVEESWLKQEGIDFIISTIPIEIGEFPVITVNPLLSKEDRGRINKLLEELRFKGSEESTIRRPKLSLKEKLIQMNSYSQGIIQVLDNFFLYTVAADSIEALIGEVSSRLLAEEAQQLQLKEDLLRREEKGGTYLSGKEISLLHCRSSSVEELYFGALRLEEPIDYLNSGGAREKIKLALIMLAPENSPQTHIEVISEVSKMIIEEPGFLKALREASREEAHMAISNHLNDFYKYKSDDRRDLHE